MKNNYPIFYLICLFCFLSFSLLTYLAVRDLPERPKKEAIKLTNLCSHSLPSNTQELRLENPEIDGNTYYRHRFYNFNFALPEGNWNLQENFTQSFEEYIAYPAPSYSLNLNLDEKQTNATEWTPNGQIIVRLLVFNNYCQSLENWFNVLPNRENLEKQKVTGNGVDGYFVTLRQNGGISYLIFNKDPWHYEFKIMIKSQEDFGKLGLVRESILVTFSDFENKL